MAELVKIKLTHALTLETRKMLYTFCATSHASVWLYLAYLGSTYVLRVTRNILYRHINGVRDFF